MKLTSPKSDWIELGRIEREWGVRGHVIVQFHNPESDLIHNLKELYFQDKSNMKAMTLEEKLKPQGKGFRANLTGVDTPEAAKAWRGKVIYYPLSALPVLEATNFYWAQLIGCEVWDDEGLYWGMVDRMEGVAAAPYLVVAAADGEERLYPAHADKIVNFDPTGRKVTVEAIW